MHLATHLFIGWSVSLPAQLSRRERPLVVVASAAPDFDAVVAIGDLVRMSRLDSFELYAKHHHLLGHNVLFAAFLSLGCLLLATRTLLVGALSALAVHLQLLADIVGSRGPEGSQWEVPYLLPFSCSWQLAVSWQWALNGWPTIPLTMCLVALAFYIGWLRGFTPVKLFSERADRAAVAALRERFGQPPTHAAA